MAYKIIPLTSNANQILTCTLPVDSKNLTLSFTFNYNGVGGYWFMSVTDPKTQTMLLDAVPLLTGDFPSADLLGQYEYLGIGSAMIIPTTSLPSSEIPSDTNLGTEFVLVWGDTVVS